MRNVLADIERDGFSIIRGAIDKDTVSLFRTVVDQIRSNPPTAAEDAELVTAGMIYNPLFSKVSGRDIRSYYSGLSSVVRGRFLVPKLLNSLILTVSGRKAKSSNPGFGYHLDGTSQGLVADTISFWSPLQPCGKTSPGLSFIKANKSQVASYIKGRTGGFIPPEKDVETWVDIYNNAIPAFGNDETPELEPGDVLAFTNWTFHSSSVSQDMTNDRSAVIARYESAFDAASRRLRRLLNNRQKQVA